MEKKRLIGVDRGGLILLAERGSTASAASSIMSKQGTCIEARQSNPFNAVHI